MDKGERREGEAPEVTGHGERREGEGEREREEG